MYYNTEEFDNQDLNEKKHKIIAMKNRKLLEFYGKYMQKFEQIKDGSTEEETLEMLTEEIIKRMGRWD